MLLFLLLRRISGHSTTARVDRPRQAGCGGDRGFDTEPGHGRRRRGTLTLWISRAACSLPGFIRAERLLFRARIASRDAPTLGEPSFELLYRVQHHPVRELAEWGTATAHARVGQILPRQAVQCFDLSRPQEPTRGKLRWGRYQHAAHRQEREPPRASESPASGTRGRTTLSAEAATTPPSGSGVAALFAARAGQCRP
jgi:hypothetical protein